MSTPHDPHGGIFGHWIDDAGLPAFAYTLDQRTDPRAEWDTHESGTSRLHWHQLGNDRIVAIGTNEGWVQLYSHEHGPRWINQHRPQEGRSAGGVSYLLDRDSGDTWSTYHPDLPQQAEVEREFGCGSLRVVVRHAGLTLDRVVFAPFGDGRLLASYVVVRNESDRVRRLRHGEQWGVQLHNLDLVPVGGDRAARRDGSSFLLYSGYGADWDARLGALVARHPRGRLSHEIPFPPGRTSRTQPDVVCVPLGTRVDGWAAAHSDVYGAGGRTAPDALLDPPNRPLAPGAAGQETAFLLTTDLELAPGEQRVLGFGYGAAPPAELADEIARLGDDPAALYDATRAAWRRALPAVDFGRDPWLGRELAWGAYYVRSGATYHHGFRAHTLSQGGAYQYLGGFNAGPRATVQHALPLVWLAPELAAEAARFTMAETTPEGEIAYAEVGSGAWEHLLWCPSDNDLWLLWLVAEYVLATRDRAFLRQSVSYWPAPYTRPEPVWDHCLRALDHLLTTVGTGPHGLIKMRLGDWNDMVVTESDVPVDRAWEESESTLNTAMAVHVLRRFAELADYHGDLAIAERVRERADAFADAVRASWRGTHVNRGWADHETEAGHLDLFLEPQPWALLTGVLGPERAATLVQEIRSRCSDPYATRIFGAGGEGHTPTVGGGQWPAINSTLAWGLATVDPAEGWRELRDNTLAHHAETYPEVWFGVWSGPDAYLPSHDDRAGETWAEESLFSMQAWPVQILFPHSEPLNASLWLSGVTPTAAGLRIDPLLPFEGWRWDGGLLSVRYGAEEVGGELGALATESVTVEVRLPSGLSGAAADGAADARAVRVTVDGAPAPARVADGMVRFRVPVGPGRRTPFRVGGGNGGA
ncbi:GH36-type glycosyl hydrolase domain-containing protein [Streptomyces monticola]|uniref:GH36-type glycosyl hydrolase domain-containing protein n=1 Tax=Streptomyces monticola TaxID=2666263 RepID=A0ABW2JW19_9ACTN